MGVWPEENQVRELGAIGALFLLVREALRLLARRIKTQEMPDASRQGIVVVPSQEWWDNRLLKFEEIVARYSREALAQTMAREQQILDNQQKILNEFSLLKERENRARGSFSGSGGAGRNSGNDSPALGDRTRRVLTLTVNRLDLTELSTRGVLLVDGQHTAWTLEPAIHSPEHPAIPAGVYPLDIRWNDKFRRPMPYIDVPGREGILIHAGNTPEDTEGCLLVGGSYDKQTPNLIGESERAFDQLYKVLERHLDAGGDVAISFLDPGLQ